MHTRMQRKTRHLLLMISQILRNASAFADEGTDYVKEIKLSLMRLQASTFARFTQRAAV